MLHVGVILLLWFLCIPLLADWRQIVIVEYLQGHLWETVMS